MKHARQIVKIISLVAIHITLSIIILSPSPAFSQVMKDYCHIPPYVGSSGGAAPNIMLVYEKGVFAGGKRQPAHPLRQTSDAYRETCSTGR
jgi:hypothetical protein